MADTFTVNYGWTKPDIGASDSTWGGKLNTDLDGIDTTVKSVSNSIPAASAALPTMNGTAAAGSSGQWADGAHVHPVDTSRYAASNPAGYQTAANVTASLLPYALLSGAAFTGAVTAPTPAALDNSTKVATTSFVATAISGFTGTVGEAPMDGVTYGRRNGVWTNIFDAGSF